MQWAKQIICRDLGRTHYETVYLDMQQFTRNRNEDTPDELWLTEHQPVFTQGQAGKIEHILAPGNIPVTQSDRGGQVTYHGPGQLVAYLLFDLRRAGCTVRELVRGIETAVQKVLELYGIEGQTRSDAPGVYVNGEKIASLGLRVRRGCSYHGLSLNISMELEPFSRINPCGLLGMQVTQMQDLVGPLDFMQIQTQMVEALSETYGFTVRM